MAGPLAGYLAPMRIAIFPGSFDPLTLGHVALVNRGLALFDRVIVAIGHNPNKRRTLSLETRFDVIRTTFANEPRVTVESYEDLTVQFATKIGATAILRGLRDATDLAFEAPLASANRKLAPTVDTVFLAGDPEHSFVSSSLMREIFGAGGDPSPWLPVASWAALRTSRNTND